MGLSKRCIADRYSWVFTMDSGIRGLWGCRNLLGYCLRAVKLYLKFLFTGKQFCLLDMKPWWSYFVKEYQLKCKWSLRKYVLIFFYLGIFSWNSHYYLRGHKIKNVKQKRWRRKMWSRFLCDFLYLFYFW